MLKLSEFSERFDLEKDHLFHQKIISWSKDWDVIPFEEKSQRFRFEFLEEDWEYFGLELGLGESCLMIRKKKVLHVSPDLKGLVIGKKGKNIKKIVEKLGFPFIKIV